MTETTGIIRPDWLLPKGVQAFVTTRGGGNSTGPCSSFNLALHVQDDPAAVASNRRDLRRQLEHLSGTTDLAMQWVQQVHGTGVLEVTQTARGLQTSTPEADAIYSTATGVVLGILTADCLPVLFCADNGSEIAIAHAGWRGLLHGVLEKTLDAFSTRPADLRVWLGPAIGPCHFEVGEDVRNLFLQQADAGLAEATSAAFKPAAVPGKWFADLYQLARLRLQASGVTNISGAAVCTCCNNDLYYSYRKQPQTGRFASLILKTA